MNDNVRFVEDLGIRLGHITGNTAYMYCPFHDSRNPHLCVDLNNPVWFCHHAECERGGHLKELERLVKKIDLNLGVDFSFDKVFNKKPAKIEKEEKEEILRFANVTIEEFLELPIAGNCKYFRDSNFSKETIEKFDIRRNLFFLIVPGVNKKGKIEGLISRAIMQNQVPRYQYTKFFPKNDLLFGINHYIEEEFTILVEGWSDTAKCHQNGATNTVGVLGSTVGKGQIQQIQKMSNKILLLLDNEEKSKASIKRISEQLIGKDIYIPDFRRYKSSDPGKMKKEELDDVRSFPVSLLKARLNGVI